MATACGRDEGARVRNIGETEKATGSGSGTGAASGSATGTGAASGTGPATGAAETPAFQESEADTRVDYRLVDYAFDGPNSAKGKRVFFTARNEGTQNHELEVLDSSGKALGEIEGFAPGAGAEPLALELEPGEYTLQCILETPDGKIHRDLGMAMKLTVT